jgi:small subunit ribosomal protein S1
VLAADARLRRERQINEAFFIRMEKIIQKTNNPLSIGATIEGKVVARDRSSLFIDLGVHGTGIIYGKEFYIVKDVIKDLNVGDKVFAKIVEVENDDGYRELSLRDATKEIGWQRLKELKESGEIINVRISGVNKGGLLTNINGIQAFLPVSQLSSDHYPRVADADKQKILKELQKFIGKTFEVKILDLMASENKLILSEKAKSEEKMKEILKDYKKGDEVDGEITGIADFGAFIKFPAVAGEEKPASQIEGLIHISELDWQLVENPSEVVKVGEIVKAKIIDISNNQVFLSLKALKTNPWEEIEKQYKKGDIIKGKVIKFSAFGAFVEIMPKIRGLCHVSEFGSKEDMENKLKIGESYDFQILLIEPKEHRMSLKLIAK